MRCILDSDVRCINGIKKLLADRFMEFSDIEGTEQRLSRAIFKLAVEVGVQTHMLAAINDIDDTTLFKLRDMVTDEVRRINGIINFESAVRYQRSEE